ncbi:hypothetical protein TG4357_03498 [Thalassovita gelatinovora]|uniref:Sulfotransferase family protein n=1 Tax=Thalassovita gelatinovora TaxID=53501 RepID=A0A0P1FJR2_THAGE|nr:hypothetical protein [Thalassovita gelatinovora]QIZ81723.1 hypothetical protein HFZ77_15190 [Thalassovita gelatinovora]CUH68295.1 hypothetical protein TG4357_03498 [Thalassovita gelatinovora]SEQ32873.1 hypothetical protein SAMN04488043_104370 [Thalassovita gelatinovora]
MLVFVDANLVLFAVPKTGSTAYHLALKGKAEISFSGKAAYKHMSLRKYERHFGPYLREAHGLTPERVAVMRHPIEQIRSWYRYRSRPTPKKEKGVLEGMRFDDFVAEVIAPRPPEFARIGSQLTFLASEDGAVRVDHLFAYERPLLLRQFLSARLGQDFETKQKNVSPQIDAPLSAEMEARLRDARAEDFALYDRIVAAGGYLHEPVSEN